MEISYAKTIREIKSNANFTIYNDDLDNIVWHDDNPTNITKAQILTKQTALQKIEDAKEENVKIAEENVKKASGKAKLKELGLDDDEIKALTGA